MKKFFITSGHALYGEVQLRPAAGAECVNIPSYVVTFPATTARKTFFGTQTQPRLFRYEPRHEKTNVVVSYLV